MKTQKIKLLLIVIVALSSFTVKAQDDDKGTAGKFGKDSNLCVQNLSLYREFYKQKNYKDAYTPWQWVFCNCPESSLNIMIHGPYILYDEIKNTKDADRRQRLIDSLFIVYDARMTYYPKDKGSVLGRKANDYVRFIPAIWDAKYKAEKDTLKKNSIRDSLASVWETAYKMYEESISIEGNNTLPSVINAYYQTAEKHMKYRNLEKTIMFDAYDKGSDIIEFNLDKWQTQYGLTVNLIDSVNANLAKGVIDSTAFLKQMEKLKKDTTEFASKLENYEKTRNNCDLTFTPYAKCQDIEKIYQKKFDANQNDIVLLEKITKIMNKKKCTGSKLFFAASTKLHDMKPTAESAYLVGVMNISKNDFAKAKEYFEQAANLAANEEQKAKSYLMLALSCSGLKQYAAARTFAYKYAALKPGDGTPYIIIGDMYSQSAASCGTDELTSRAANWAAADKYMKAKAVDKSKEAEANQRLNAVATRFPKKEAIFFNGLNKGQAYTVGCWINETTTVR